MAKVTRVEHTVPTVKRKKKVAAYARISMESERMNHSLSAQISYYSSLIQKNPDWEYAGVFADDDYSGTSFDRPSFNRMIADIEEKKVNCVVTKDLSRLGRNYIDSGSYMEIYFPEKGVRYVAVDDNIDSLHESSMQIAPFKNLLNEMYAKDISEKIKSAKKIKAEQGKFIGAFAPYGYYKDPQNHNHLLVDENTAPTVRRIYQMYLQGYGIKHISNVLTTEGVPTPSGKDRWNANTIQSILKNPVYAGKIVVLRRTTVSFKSKKRKNNGWNGMGVVDNTHEAIVSEQEQEQVEQIMKGHRRVLMN
ncbi:MAG: recombinase family protein [Ruminococcus sp.]|nr:recombinase family protein [Ruminococcus sp.]